ncbi:hypothetical protein AX16_006995 [Volvariella volvacea WC 439]|nr:hypothetical protein AX16_006995 [Volvariella volvacea WC 439]
MAPASTKDAEEMISRSVTPKTQTLFPINALGESSALMKRMPANHCLRSGAPPNFRELADTTGRGQNFNGSVCLNNVCMWANVTVGLPCEVENTAYIAYEPAGEFINIVSRGNCRIGLYCDAQQRVCLRNKPIGAACTADKECDSWNCMANGYCGQDASTPHHFGIWVYVIVALGIFGGMFGTLISLFVVHRKQREEEREKRIQYWREQNAFHQNLLQMRETARNSILSATSERRNTYNRDNGSDDMQGHIFSAPKASGLRNYYADDNSSEYDEGVMMQGGRKTDGRF